MSFPPPHDNDGQIQTRRRWGGDDVRLRVARASRPMRRSRPVAGPVTSTLAAIQQAGGRRQEAGATSGSD